MNFFVHNTAICESNNIGNNTKIWHFCHIRQNSKIGANCIFGKGVYVDSDVTIGDNCKFQNNVNVYHGVTIENNVFVGPNSTFTNDLYPRALIWNDSLVVNTHVKEGASIGALSVIICGVTLGKYCMIGSGSVVTKNVPDYGLVLGNPAKLVAFVCECGHKLITRLNEDNLNIKFKCDTCEKIININKKDYELLKKNIM
jgi:acetyltransferase-like isoleucine patch superfamily enzyme